MLPWILVFTSAKNVNFYISNKTMVTYAYHYRSYGPLSVYLQCKCMPGAQIVN